jgi:ATP-binding cassette subfamily F protein 3
MVLISHDRYFINRVADKVAEVGNGDVVLFEGDYDTWLEQWQDRTEEGGEVTPGLAERRNTDRVRKRAEAEERNRLHRRRQEIRKRLDPVEQEIAELEERVEELEARQADPEVYADPDAATRVARAKGVAEKRLEELYPLWEKMTEELP